LSDEVLSAVAACEGEVSGVHLALVGEVGYHARVLIVRMRGDV